MTRDSDKIQRQLGRVMPDRPIQAGRLEVPRGVRLLGNRILWGERWGFGKSVRPGTGMLFQFSELWSQTDADILRFAQRWGVLGICKHHLPVAHLIDVVDMDACPPKIARTVQLKDRTVRFICFDWIEDWRKYSRMAYSILNLGAELNLGRLGDDSEWHCLEPIISKVNIGLTKELFGWPAVSREIKVRRWLMIFCLDLWLHMAGATVSVDWNSKRQWRITLGPRFFSVPPLLGHIGLALVLAISQQDGLAICSSCHKSYIPSRRPNPHRRNYCPSCGISAAWRDAARIRRMRLHQQKGL